MLVKIVMVTCTVLVISGGHFLVLFILAPLDYVVSLILFFIFCEGPILMSAMSMSYSPCIFIWLCGPISPPQTFRLHVFGHFGATPYMVLHIYGRLVIVVMLSLIDFVKYFSWFSFSLCHKNILWKMQVSKTIPKT